MNIAFGDISVIGLFISLLVGWLAGGLANMAADVLPYARQGGVSSRPHAPHAYHFWSLWWYPWRGGRCPRCGERLTRRAPLLEISMVLAFIIAWGRFGAQPLTLSIAWLYTFFLLIVLVIDLEHRRVLNVVLAPAALIILLLSILPGNFILLNALLGGAVGFGLFFIIALLGRGAMGYGDVKLAAVIGLMTGFPEVLPTLIIGIILGGLAALLLLLTKRAGRKSYFAYAPYLAVGALIMLYWTLAG